MRVRRLRIFLVCLLLVFSADEFSALPDDSSKLNQVTSTSKPNLQLRNIVYDGDLDNISGNWTTDTNQPIINAEIKFSFFINDTTNRILLILSASTNVNGDFEIELNYTGWLPGKYFWFIQFQKEGYQQWNITENIELIPHTYDITIDVEPELVDGDQFRVAAFISYNSTDSDKFGLGAPDLEVRFIFNVIYDDGIQKLVPKVGISNEFGIVVVSLTSSETKSLQSIESITVIFEIGDVEFTSQIKSDDLPIVTSKDESIFDRFVEFAEKNTMLFVFLSIFFGLSTVILLIRRNKIPLKQSMWPKHEK
ncbi:MAG: hypothetical protein ACW99Q_28670 [Candidatus Kariarchaeaceae archaeon]